MRYVMYIAFCTNISIISSMFCTLPGHNDSSSGKPLDTFKLLNPGTNSSWVMHKYIPKGGTSCHEALQNMLDGMANNGVLAILLQEAFKAAPTA